MKVLVNRTWSFISSRLTIASINYGWSIRTDYSIFIRLMKYLKINTVSKGKKFSDIYWKSVTPYNFRNIIPLLSASSLRSLIKLSEYILCHPMYFDFFIKPAHPINSIQLEKILCQGYPNLDKIHKHKGLVSLVS